MSFLAPLQTAYAALDYTDRHVYVIGDQIGILTNRENVPLQEIESGTGVNLGDIDTTDLIAYFGGDVYGSGKSTGTGEVLISQMVGAVNGTIPCNPTVFEGYSIDTLSHNEIKSFTKSLTVSQGSGTSALQVQCLNGILDTTNAVENTTISCNAGYINTGDDLCVANLCGGSTPANSEVLSGTTQSTSQNWTK